MTQPWNKDYSVGPFDARTDKLLEDFERLMLKEWGDLSGHEPTSLLWHYTDAEGFKDIVLNGTFRFSHARLLNDPTEIAYGWSHVTQALDAEIAQGGNLKDFFTMARVVAGEVHDNYHYFVFSLSSRPDSLSQWRAYGSGGAGYSLGFDPATFRAARPEGEFFLVKLIYQEKDQKAVISSGTKAARQFFNQLLSKPVPKPNGLKIRS